MAGTERRQRIFDVGELLCGTYEVGEVLGQGGMGQVLAAFDRLLQRKIAVKASWPHVDRALLRAEAQALAALRHPNMLSVYALCEHDHVPFLAMERIFGIDLRAHLARRAREGLAVSSREAIDLILPVAESLAAMHAAGLAHRDVKPANVMLTVGGRVVLMDFGLSVPQSVTLPTDVVHGTPEYMAPEAVSASVERGDTPLIDTYSLGILMYEVLAGQVPFRGDTPSAVMRAHLGEPVPNLLDVRPDVPPELSRLIGELLAKDPADRPPTMEAIVFRLRALRSAASKPHEGTPMRVLVIEDDRATRRMIALIARKGLPDAQVTEAATADEALAQLRSDTPDVILLDLHLPGMNGIELMMYLRGSGLAETSSVVAISAGAQDQDLALLRELGVYHFVRKGDRLLEELPTLLRELHRLRAPRATAGDDRTPSARRQPTP